MYAVRLTENILALTPGDGDTEERKWYDEGVEKTYRFLYIYIYIYIYGKWRTVQAGKGH